MNVFVLWSLVISTVAVVVTGVEPAAADDQPEWVEDLGEGGTTERGSVPWEESEVASLAEGPEPTAPLEEADLPGSAAWDVTLGDEGEPAEQSSGEEGPVEIAAAADGFEGDVLQIEVFDQEVAEQAGASGLVFGVSETDGGDQSRESGEDAAGDVLSDAADGEGLPAELSVDYSGFAEAFGAGYAGRLEVVALPDCVLVDPVPEGCASGGVPVDSSNDLEAQELVVEVDDLAELAVDGVELEGASADWAANAESGADTLAEVAAAGSGGALFAVTADVSSEQGSYAATPQSAAGRWQVSPGSGEFSYSYGIDAPEPAGGTAPTVGLSYSSGAVDGLTNATNTQASSTGVGWSPFENAFIERRYDPCVNTLVSTDLCWNGYNATISLDGVAGPLLPVDPDRPGGPTQWRVSSDPGWKVERLTGADNADDWLDPQSWRGEYWKVTGTDGTEYFFGLGQNPDTGEATDSVSAVPVFADHNDERCWGNLPGNPNSFGLCHEPWRWNLDRVVDPDGNITTYTYYRERNRYAGLNGQFDPLRYHRASLVREIKYGARAESGAGAEPTARVVFSRQYRCNSLSPSCPEPDPNQTNTSAANHINKFPDVPGDLLCSSNDCSNDTPSFFTTKRYSSVRTEVRAGDDWRPVMQTNLYHTLSKGTGTEKKLYLQELQRVGLADPDQPLTPLPVTQFNYVWLDNRVDVGSTRPPLPHARVDEVINEMGGRIEVTYGQNRACNATYRPNPWSDNDRDCFPQTMNDDGFRRVGVFNKYLVTQTNETGGSYSSAMVTDYTYEGTPAWAYNYGSFAQYDLEWGWSIWRGYQTTRITEGGSPTTFSPPVTTRVRVFRGMNGDPLWVDRGGGEHCPCGVREANVEPFDGSTPVPDDPALAGRVLEEAIVDEADPETVLQSTRYEYERKVTLDRPVGQLDAEWAGVASVTESMATDSGDLRGQRTTTTYNERTQPGWGLLPPQAVTSVEEGWLNVDGDERCSRTTYADNLDEWMFEYPASNVTVAGDDCDSNEVVSESETYYDGSTTLGAAPTRGNPTRARTRLDSQSWAETVTDYDELGRVVSVTDPNGAATTTSYEAIPAHARPTETMVTNALGHTQTTEWVPELAAPLREIDANGNVATYAYDGLGRLTAVWLPTEEDLADGWAPSWQFSYSEDQRVVRSRQLTAAQESPLETTYEDTWVLYDQLGREVQTQQLSPEPGKVIVNATTYNDKGQTLWQMESQALEGTPGTYLGNPNLWSSWDNSNLTAYDDLGRERYNARYRNASNGRVTRFEYTPDSVTVTGPDGGKVRETTDGLGRTVEVAEHDGTDWVVSSYGYDLADNLVSIADPSGNEITYTYDLASRRLSQDDPDRGTASFGYDAAGSLTTVVDGLDNAVHTAYDSLGRPVERRAESSSGPLLASWDYDAEGELGLLDSETRHTTEGDWTSEVTGYDKRNRALGTTLTVPEGIPGLSGQYTTSQSYDRADRVTSVTLPAIGDLPEETITTNFNNLGLPTQLSGIESYVRTTTYDDRGRLTGAAFGPTAAGGAPWMAKGWSYDGDQQLASSETYVADSAVPDGVVARHELTYDRVGNLTDQATSLNGQAWRECFEHDARHRMTRAYTVEQASACGEGTPGTGDQPYEHRFDYHPDGRLNHRTEVVDPDEGDRIPYEYPASGSDQPHAPTSVGTNTYEWDGNGNLTERTVESDTETLSWDVEQQLTSVQGPEGTTSFVYDAAGQRLLRRTDDGATLYFAGHEIRANADGSHVTTVRSYTFEGQLVATRIATGVSYAVTDAAGSVEMAVASGGQPTANRTYEPFGQVRTEDGEMDTDQGFIGQMEDDTTQLSYLNARYYDTETGVFASADTVYDTGNIKSLNPYTYAGGNPTSFSDPSGMSPSYIHGVETQNWGLRYENKQLRGHIKYLGNRIEDLQSIIRKQNRTINKLVTRIRTLERIVQQQQSIIRRLVDRVNYLVGVVNYQRTVIGRLQAKIAYQQRIIAWQAGRIRYYQGVVNILGWHIWGGTGHYTSIMASIHSGAGIPAGAFAVSRLTRLENQVAALQGEVAALRGGGGGGHNGIWGFGPIDWYKDVKEGFIGGGKPQPPYSDDTLPHTPTTGDIVGGTGAIAASVVGAVAKTLGKVVSGTRNLVKGKPPLTWPGMPPFFPDQCTMVPDRPPCAPSGVV